MQSTSSHHWFRTTPLNQLPPVRIYSREQSGIPSVLLLPRREEHLHLRTLLLPGTKTPKRIKWTYTLHLHKIRQRGLTEQKLWVYSLELHSFNRKTHRRSYLYWCTVVLLGLRRHGMAGRTCLIVGVMLLAAAAPALAVSIALDDIFPHYLICFMHSIMYCSNKAMQPDTHDCIEVVLFTIECLISYQEKLIINLFLWIYVGL